MKRYARVNWKDFPSTNTPRNASTFNIMDKGIDDIDNAVENVQAQVDQLVVSGDSSPAAAQAQVGADGNIYGSLKTRLDTEYNKHSSELEQNIIVSPEQPQSEYNKIWLKLIN